VIDLGLTHIALVVADVDVSADFYSRYAGMRVVHERTDPATRHRVVWLSDLSRPFAIVLIETDVSAQMRLGGFNHLGVACASRERVDALLADARAEGRDVLGPFDSGPPVGYWGFVVDPDGHNLELSYGQEVGVTVEGAAR
jgi:catechol 2,3-dioxygenase-like lactoylglutathione lyase family enzyme